jgi:perosamine synthetase
MTAPIPWFGPDVGEREKQLVAEVLDSGYINDGQITRQFERRIAELVGVNHCVAVSSGTAAITLALMAAEVGPGDEVLVPDLTFIATANAVRLAGADVRLVDVEPARFSIDPERLESSIGPRTRAVVTVDVNGRAADYLRIEEICKRHGLTLICDAAEALGSAWRGRMLGTYGLAGCFSFSANKTVSTGQGGMIATDSDAVHERLRELKDQGRRHQGTGGDDLHPVMGYNFKLTNIQAAVGLAQLERLEERLEHARIRDSWYRELHADVPGVQVPPVADDGEALQWTDVLIDGREPVVAALDSLKIGCRAFWHPLHRQAPYQASDDAYATAISVSERGLWLPSHFRLSRSEAERAVEAIRKTIAAGRKNTP